MYGLGNKRKVEIIQTTALLSLARKLRRLPETEGALVSFRLQ